MGVSMVKVELVRAMGSLRWLAVGCHVSARQGIDVERKDLKFIRMLSKVLF